MEQPIKCQELIVKITQNSEIYVGDNRYLLEVGDEIHINKEVIEEGLMSRALWAVISKILPLDVFRKLPREFQIKFANLAKKDPKKAKKASELFDLLGY